ncbi:MAG: hypothetical protein ACI9FJ_002173 [Alteromonadaceae bacterium]|jgi:hypothetical protein
MSLAPLSSPSAPANADPGGEVISASLAKKQQVMEGKQAMQLLQTAGQVATPKPPSGASGHNVNVVV